MTPAIETRGLTRTFGRREAVRDLDLRVPRGSFYALVGPNGAGKTTTLRMLVNLLRPTAGRACVLGNDSRKLSARDFAHIGYVSGDTPIPGWARVDRLVEYWRPFYPTWDDALCRNLVARFGLPMDRKVSELSRGMRVKLALLLALAYRPRLLVLDEPFGGLDPLVREELIEGTLELASNEDWAILVSSHDLAEVERLADHIGYLEEGRLLFSDPLVDLQERYREVEVVLEEVVEPAVPIPEDWLDLERSDRVWRFVDRRFDEHRTPALVRQLLPTARAVNVARVSLHRIFLANARTSRTGGKP